MQRLSTSTIEKRLIRSKIEIKYWGIWGVKEWMGHEEISTTEDYVKFAKQYCRHSSYDWISAMLKFYKTNTVFLEQQNGTSEIGEKQVGKKRALASVVSHVEVNAPVGI